MYSVSAFKLMFAGILNTPVPRHGKSEAPRSVTAEVTSLDKSFLERLLYDATDYMRRDLHLLCSQGSRDRSALPPSP